MNSPLDWMADALEDMRTAGLLRRRRSLTSSQGARVQIGGREYVNFSSNDYLNLASDERLARAAAVAGRRYGTGAGASPLVSGWSRPVRVLERELAAWEGTESALVFSSGYAANLAVLTSLAGPEDIVFSDQLNHASLIDGCRLSRATVHVYRHADLKDLEGLLRRARGRRKVIVSDSVFSMDGDLAPVRGLLELAERFDALLVLDEAHATGVLGEEGRGVAESLPASIDRRRLVKVGTLSKALGSQGGFVCGPKLLCQYLVNKARPYIFSTALAPPSAAAAREAVRVVREEPERRRHLVHLVDLLRDRLRPLGHRSPEPLVPIVPIVVGPAADTLKLSRRLQRQGLLVPAIRPPSVPDGTARLRISLTAGHQPEDVERLADALTAAVKKSLT